MRQQGISGSKTDGSMRRRVASLPVEAKLPQLRPLRTDWKIFGLLIDHKMSRVARSE